MSNKYIKNQGWFAFLNYNVLTLGIYSIFWFKNIRKDSVVNSKVDVISLFLLNFYSILVFILLVNTLTGYVNFFGFFHFQNTINQIIIKFGSIANGLYWVFVIVLALQVRKYLQDTYGIELSGFWTFVFNIFYLQYKISKNYEKISEGNSSISSVNEEEAKKFIEEYRLQLSRESIKSSLINSSTSGQEAEIYLDKYY